MTGDRGDARGAGGRRGEGPPLLVPRPGRALFEASGRRPAGTLDGLLSGATPPEHRIVAGGRARLAGGDGLEIRRGRMPHSALLTPRGRIVTDLRVGRIEGGETGSLLLDLPRAGVEGARAHFTRFLPPRLARVEERPELGVVGLVGEDGPERLAAALGTDPSLFEGGGEGDEWVVGSGPGALRVVRSGEVLPPAFDLIGPRELLAALERELLARGVVRGDEAAWEVMRIEKGRPAFGVEVDSETLPPEAGMERRCIDHTKGCYTGQEVIVRIRDRGHVNRSLRGLLFGDAPGGAAGPAPAGPTELRGARLFDRDGKEVGEVRSAVRSPRFGGVIGLGYLRREVEPPTVVRGGGADGPTARVRALSDEGWVLVEGDPSPYP